jgi:translation initiation factor 4B
MDNREPRMNRNFSNEGVGRPERREMNLPSAEAGVDKWERKGPLPPPQETNERRPRTGGYGSRSGSGNFGAAPTRSPPVETAADTGEWRTAKPLPPTTRSDGSIFLRRDKIDILDTPPPASPALGGSPALQRRKLALLPRSEHPQEPAPTPLSPSDEVKPKSNPFGSARPVDTDSALKKVEEKLAKEKEHVKEEKESSKTATAAANPSPTSPTGPRVEKSRPNPKQLLRRTSAKDTSVPATAAKSSEIDEVVAAKAEAQEESINEDAGKSWRKVETPVAATAPEEEAGWETVPPRTKKANGVGARH